MAASPYPFSHSRLRAPRSRRPPRFSLDATLCLPSHRRSLVLPRPLNSIPSLNLPSADARPCSSDHLSPKSTLRRPPRASVRSSTANEPEEEPNGKPLQDEEVKDLGVRVALSMLKFYKREISPLMLSSCRYVPTCSEYSMQAYKKYGVVKGTVLTAWRLCRCNPLGGSGYDPPRWFGEEEPYEQP